jgi:hypothetical protein
VRLESESNQRQCILVLMGATADGKKELVSIMDGYRESEQSGGTAAKRAPAWPGH